VVRVYDHNISVYQGKVVSEQIQTINPLTWIGEFLARFRVPKLPDLPRFSGGLVGYFGYDTVRYIEPVCAKGNLKDPLETPDILLMLSDEVVVFDNIKCKLHLIVHANPSETDAFALAQRRLNTLVARLRENEPVTYHTPEGKHIKECDFKSGFSRVHYEQAVQRAKKYIKYLSCITSP